MQRIMLLALAIVMIVSAVAWIAATPSSSVGETESANLKVLKVFSAKYGDARFQAYMVNWKGQDVIVADVLVTTDLHEGDTISVLMTRHKYPGNRPGPDLLHFSVQPFRAREGE
jgi:hypothetical protein